MGGTISTDTTWTLAGSPYIVTSNIIVRGTDGPDNTTTLTIEAGVAVRFNSCLYVIVGFSSNSGGALLAEGTADQPVVFTSNQATPAAGDWQGIIFRETAHTSTLSHCKVQYAGSYSSSAISVESAAPHISNTVFENNLAHDLAYTGTAGGLVSNCTLHNGVSLLVDSPVDFTGNTFNWNNNFPAKTYADNVHNLVNGNTYTNLTPESYLLVISGNVTRDAVWTAAIPYFMANSVHVQGTDGADAVTTLTIQAGAVLKFQNSKGLRIGTSYAPGALQALGSAEQPILFTSVSQAPYAGIWTGLYFFNLADDGSTMDNCIVQYANDAIFTDNMRLSLRSCTLKHNGRALLVAGADSFQADIRCNTFEANTYGIYLGSRAQPMVKWNNFMGNACGLYNGSGLALAAEDNWWNDPQGPNQSGDGYSGNVDADPWSTAEIVCIAGEPNQAPEMPTAPAPADQAVRVDIANGIDLLWTGGDPNALDIVTYDLHKGTAADDLALLASDLAVATHHLDNLSPGVTYFWKVVAKDNHGLQTQGPVWRFTAAGDPPDLIVSGLSTTPAGHLQSGQGVTLTAQLTNIGAGPAVDPFTACFKVDGAAIGSPSVTTVIPAGATAQVNQSWTYGGGDPSLQIMVDDQNQVSETNETNNTFTALLSEVADNAPPVLVQALPSAGAYTPQVNQVQITLADLKGAVDDAAVMASFALADGQQQAVAGSISELNDTFTFVPNSVPMPDGAYHVTLTASDTYGNSQNYAFEFTIDSMPPEKPVITGAAVASGTIQPRPVQNTTDLFIVELTGLREAGTSVWINNAQRVELGDANWSVNLDLAPGANSIEVWLKDRAGNQGESEWVDIQVTTVDPVRYEYDAAGRVETIHSNQP